MTDDLFGVAREKNPDLICCYKILQMVGLLHSRGYQRLRIFPYGRGFWGCELAPGDLFDPSNGACMESSSENDRAGLIARFSSGGGCRPFSWKRDISRMSLPLLADLFLKRYPAIAARSLGSDWAYAGWYQEMLMRTSADLLPVAYFHDDFEEVECSELCLFPVGDARRGEMSLPPLFVCKA